jgi:hypothetical protein
MGIKVKNKAAEKARKSRKDSLPMKALTQT